MIKRGSNNPNWGSIPWILDRVSVRRGRAATQQEADRQAAWEDRRAKGRVEEGDAMRNYLGARYELLRDIDLAGRNWQPIGTDVAPFNGSFDGKGYTISNLSMRYI